MTRWWITRAPVLLVMLSFGALQGPGLQAQGRTVSELRDALQGRYGIVALQRGVALVPRRPDGGVRMIEIVDGLVRVDGDTVTGRELNDRLGRDADLILQVSYLSPAAQAELVAPASPAGAPPLVDGTTPPPPPAPFDPDDDIPRPQVRNGDLVRIGGSVTVGRDERIEGDVVVVFGSADVDGEVEGEVTVVMGSLNLGASALVRDDVQVIGGSLNRQDGARVLGSVEEIGIGQGDFRRDRGRGFPFPEMFGSFWPRVGSVATTVLRVMLILLAALVAVALGRGSVERVADRTAADPLRSGFVGLLAELLFIPLLVVVVVVLAVSIVGIPLLVLVPFGILAVGALMVVGFAGLAYHLGRLLTGRFGWPADGAYLPVAVGVVAIMGLTLVARLASLAIGSFIGAPFAALGYAVEYVAWTIGFGATILAWFGSRRAATTVGPPPPLPSQS